MMDEDEENNTILQRQWQHLSNKKKKGKKNARSLRRGGIHVKDFDVKKRRKKSSTNKHVHDDDDEFEYE
ncbi:hypothetical protein PsorP6_014333 [Peronosclerospora sorghi]|uniref:Uncharacterized protein n=1 Tax=Peronosclerospora sorghi TaxID=230839 RepID=A0ACC0VH84_9STRA|nr:hypothetical protein PsorP6_014333 [Peronosclerospora sorghi]